MSQWVRSCAKWSVQCTAQQNEWWKKKLREKSTANWRLLCALPLEWQLKFEFQMASPKDFNTMFRPTEWMEEREKDHSHRLATNHAHKTNENYVVVAREYRHSLWCLGPCDLRRRSSIMYYLMWCIAFFFSATNCKWKFFRSKYFQIQMENWIRQMPEIHTHRKNLLACLFSFAAYRHSI